MTSHTSVVTRESLLRQHFILSSVLAFALVSFLAGCSSTKVVRTDYRNDQTRVTNKVAYIDSAQGPTSANPWIKLKIEEETSVPVQEEETVQKITVKTKVAKLRNDDPNIFSMMIRGVMGSFAILVAWPTALISMPMSECFSTNAFYLPSQLMLEGYYTYDVICDVPDGQPYTNGWVDAGKTAQFRRPFSHALVEIDAPGTQPGKLYEADINGYVTINVTNDLMSHLKEVPKQLELTVRSSVGRKPSVKRIDLGDQQNLAILAGQSPAYELNREGIALADSGSFEAAANKFMAAASVDSTFAMPLFNLGLLAEKQHQPENALKYYYKCMQMDQKAAEADQVPERIIRLLQTLPARPAVPEQAPAHIARAADIYKTAKSPNDYERAWEALKMAQRLAPWLPEIYFNLSTASESLGGYASAARYLKLYLLATPNATDMKSVQDRISVLEAKM